MADKIRPIDQILAAAKEHGWPVAHLGGASRPTVTLARHIAEEA